VNFPQAQELRLRVRGKFAVAFGNFALFVRQRDKSDLGMLGFGPQRDYCMLLGIGKCALLSEKCLGVKLTTNLIKNT
jgi:hypothetical protein